MLWRSSTKYSSIRRFEDLHAQNYVARFSFPIIATFQFYVLFLDLSRFSLSFSSLISGRDIEVLNKSKALIPEAQNKQAHWLNLKKGHSYEK